MQDTVAKVVLELTETLLRREFSDSDQKRMMNKMDDVRFDLRSTRNILGASLFALAGGLAFVGVASVFRTSKGK